MRAAGRPLVALALAAAVLAAPAPRAAGQGSSGIVGVTNIGSGAEETWVLLPGEDPPSCLVVFLHDASEPTPSRYLGWLDHLAIDAACAVIFPRYQLARNTAPTTLSGLRAGVSAGVVHVRRARFGFEGRRVPKKLRTVVVGVGLGGSLAFYYAANAKRWGLPVPAGDRQHLPHVGEYLRPAARAGSSQRTGDRPDARWGSGRARVPRPAPRFPQALPDGSVAGERASPDDAVRHQHVLGAGRRADRLGQSNSTSGNERCLRGGTRKF